MSYSRRQLYAVGEPLGDSATREEAGRIIHGSGGGGGGSATQTQITDVPDWVKPYAEDALKRTSTLTQNQPYQSFGQWAQKAGVSGQTVAGPQALQTRAYEGIAGMQPSAATGLGSATAALASERALGTGYQERGFQSQFQAPGQYSPSQFQNPFQAPGQFQAAGERAPQLQQYGMGPAQQVGTQSFAQPGSAEAYMSPYMQNVVEKQQREAQRTADIAGTQRGAQAVGSGAFGGSRQAIMEAEAARNLAQQKGDIQATGTQAAYQQAQQQFNAEQQARMQAQMANQQAGLTVGQQNLAAQLGVQQLGATTGLQAQQLAEQSRQFGAGQGLSAAQLQAQYGMSAQQAQEAANQFAAQQAMTGAQTGAQYGQAAQQLGEQSRQYGAGLGLQGLQTALQGAGQLGTLGSQQFGQAMDINKLQQAYGTQQQQLEQQKIAALQQEYGMQEKYPYQQLEFMSNIMRGTPMGTVQSLYGAQPTTGQNIASLGMGAYGVSQLMKADGGTVSSYAEGGSIDSAQNIESIVDKLSDSQLKQAAQTAQARGDMEQLDIIQKEMASRASERGGMMGAFNQLPQGQQQQMARMAGGGIIAFAGDEDENDETTGQLVEDRIPVGRGDPAVYGQAMSGLQAIQKRLSADKGYTPLTPAEEAAMYGRSTARGKEIYGDVLSKIKGSIEAQRGEGEESLSQGRGIAALQAAAAMSKGRGFAQGLSQAGGAFGESYGKALQANTAQKRALSNMELSLAKAEADQRMGLHDKAEAQIAKANAYREKAYSAGTAKTKAEADVLYKTGRLAMPPAPAKPTGGPKPLKIAEQLAEAEVAHETNPTEASLSRVTALRRAVGQTRTSDYGPTRAGQVGEGLDVRLGEAITKEQGKVKFSPEYLEATPAQRQVMLKAAADRVRANAARESSGDYRLPVNNNPPQVGSSRLQFDAQGNRIP